MVKKTVWFVFLMMVALSCLDEPDCYSLNNNVVGIAFKKLSDNKADTVFFQQITAEGTDSIFFSDVLVYGGVDKLPLNFYQNETIFHFVGLNKTYDLELSYSAKSQLVSEECGERFVLTGLKTGAFTFDSVRVVNATPKRNDGRGTHLEIYRCPDTRSVKVRFSTAVKISDITTDYETAILYNAELSTSSVIIPLNIESQTSIIQFEIEGQTKSLTLTYKSDQQTLFSTCGPQTVLSDFEVVSTTFNSVIVKRNTIQDPPQTNLEITL